MATISIPNDSGNIIQPNSGSNRGTVYSSYGIDYDANVGTLQVAPQVKKLVTEVGDADFSGYAGAIVPYSDDGVTGKIFAVSDATFSADFTDPTGTWTEETAGSEPSVNNTDTDAVLFDGLLLVADSTDINAWNGTTWNGSYWQSTLGQSALTTGNRHLMKVGSDGNLYIAEGGNKLFKVHPVDGATVTGEGTLDFSATNYEFTSMAATSTRLFIGAKSLAGGDGVIIEWDMSPSSLTANKIHSIGAQSVPCIAVWNDTAIAVLSNGKLKQFTGGGFADMKGFQFPLPDNVRLDDEFIHPNGWDIIDDLPHFFATGNTANRTPSTFTGAKEADWAFPAAVWCLDPDIGLYPRFPVGTGEDTQSDYGKPVMRAAGALFAYKAGPQETTKFLCSYEYYGSDRTTRKSVLAYHDNSNSQASRGWLATPFALSLREAWKSVEMFNKPMPAGCSVRVFTRTEDTDPIRADGTWVDTLNFNFESVGTGIEANDLVYVKMGNGTNQWLKVKSVSESATVTSIVLAEANEFVSTGETGVLEIFKFRFMGEVDSPTADYKSFTIQDTQKKRKRQFLFEFRQAATTKIEVDTILAST